MGQTGLTLRYLSHGTTCIRGLQCQETDWLMVRMRFGACHGVLHSLPFRIAVLGNPVQQPASMLAVCWPGLARAAGEDPMKVDAPSAQHLLRVSDDREGPAALWQMPRQGLHPAGVTYTIHRPRRSV